ncbi:MAG TPA: hypothetical protein VJ438_01475 [Candidatus Nanoarchaeia archaeon]|nr:hypothetical protein [Candidatus Nanoarchaeia archaeon]
MKDIETLTLYISAWNWQILAMIFLMFTLLFLTIVKTLSSVVFTLVGIILFVGCEYISLKRRGEFFEEENYDE